MKAACTLWGCQKYVLDLHGCTGGEAVRGGQGTGRPGPRVQSEQAEAHSRLGGLEPVGSLTASPWVSALSPRPHGKVTAPQTDRWLKGGAQARSASVQSWRFPSCTISSWELSLPPLAAGQGGHLNVAQHLDLSKVTLDADADVTGP